MDNDRMETILRALGGVYFSLAEAMDAETSARAVAALRHYANENAADCPDAAEICRALANSQSRYPLTTGSLST
jgi:hypothetical protein